MPPMATPAQACSQTPHGAVRTPAFMPVATQGAMKAIHWREIRDAGADIVLGNTYHLMLRPGAERVAALGGLHAFSTWHGPILTDSGGFQVMSLAQLRKVSEQSVVFRSHIDGATVELSPERSIEIQRLLGSDIVMQLDECVRLPASPAEIERAMQLSLRWAERSKRAFEGAPVGHLLFGIVQGGDVPVLREGERDGADVNGFDGYAIGGLAVGEPQETMLAMIEETAPLLPTDRPRYLMGVGTPDDIVKAVARGIDMFDCVMPTRNGRHGLRSPGAARSICAMRAMRTIRGRWTRRATGRRRAIIRALICIISSKRVKRWAGCCFRNQHRLLSVADERASGRHCERHLRCNKRCNTRSVGKGDIVAALKHAFQARP